MALVHRKLDLIEVNVVIVEREADLMPPISKPMPFHVEALIIAGAVVEVC